MLITGRPGSGKTLRCVQRLVEAKGEGRPTFHIDIDGCDSSVATPWASGVENWRDLPPTAVLVIDEAHNHLPIRPNGKPPAPWLAKLTEIRHTGVTIILLTQQPAMVDHFVRGLVTDHEHFERKAGAQVSICFRWEKAVDKPEEKWCRKTGVKSVYRFPKRLFGLYKSASVHLRQRRVPWFVYAGVVAVVLFAWSMMSTLGVFAKFAGNATGMDDPSSASAALGTMGVVPHGSVGGSFAERFTPQVPGIPWTAPAFANQEVQSKPDLYCIATAKVCQCFTEQVTRVPTDEQVCLMAARFGVYNPYRAPVGSSSRDRDREPRSGSRARLDNPRQSSASVRADWPSRPVGAYIPPQLVPQPPLYGADQ